MTREDYAKLTKEERQAKIAALCGWWEGGPEPVPDFARDPGAMYEAEQAMPEDKEPEWLEHMIKVVCDMTCNKEGQAVVRAVPLLRATAAQRAEAFVLTMEAKK